MTIESKWNASHCLSAGTDMLSLSDINYDVLIHIKIVLSMCVYTVYLLNMCSIKTQVLLRMLFMCMDFIRAMKSFFLPSSSPGLYIHPFTDFHKTTFYGLVSVLVHWVIQS